MRQGDKAQENRKTEGKTVSNREFMKMKAVQSIAGAIVLTLLMNVFGLTGYGAYTWMLFLPLLLFFALGADFRKIPSMFLCYCCGVAWSYLNSLVQSLFESFLPGRIAGIVTTILVIFLILLIHEGLLRNTQFGNIPALFLGMATMFSAFMLNQPVNGLHLIGFFAFGLLLCVLLVLVGTFVCNLVFGKEKVQRVLFGREK